MGLGCLALHCTRPRLAVRQRLVWLACAAAVWAEGLRCRLQQALARSPGQTWVLGSRAHGGVGMRSVFPSVRHFFVAGSGGCCGWHGSCDSMLVAQCTSRCTACGSMSPHGALRASRVQGQAAPQRRMHAKGASQHSLAQTPPLTCAAKTPASIQPAPHTVSRKKSCERHTYMIELSSACITFPCAVRTEAVQPQHVEQPCTRTSGLSCSQLLYITGPSIMAWSTDHP